jgi:hypothetical protein
MSKEHSMNSRYPIIAAKVASLALSLSELDKAPATEIAGTDPKDVEECQRAVEDLGGLYGALRGRLAVDYLRARIPGLTHILVERDTEVVAGDEGGVHFLPIDLRYTVKRILPGQVSELSVVVEATETVSEEHLDDAARFLGEEPACGDEARMAVGARLIEFLPMAQLRRAADMYCADARKLIEVRQGGFRPE